MADAMTSELRPKWVKLAQLANFLDDLPHDRFHMPRWSSDDSTENSCGTAGCACGWAATVWRDEWIFIKNVHGSLPRLRGEVNDNFWPAYSFARFFGISSWEGDWITTSLSPDNCNHGDGRLTYTAVYGLPNENFITPRHAADRIRKVLARYDPTVLDERSKPAMPEVAHA